MKIIIMFIYITIAVAQTAQHNYVTAAAIIVLYAINEIISEQRYHKLKNQHNKAVFLKIFYKNYFIKFFLF